jgi:hypothetical protein
MRHYECKKQCFKRKYLKKDVPREIWKKYTSTCTYTALLKIVIKLI